MPNWVAHQPERLAGLKQVVMIQCVQPQEADHFYCSRTCCAVTAKQMLREAFTYQKEGRCFSLVEILSTCPTNSAPISWLI